MYVDIFTHDEGLISLIQRSDSDQEISSSPEAPVFSPMSIQDITCISDSSSKEESSSHSGNTTDADS